MSKSVVSYLTSFNDEVQDVFVCLGSKLHAIGI